MADFCAVGTEGIDIGTGSVGAVADVEVAGGGVDVDAIGVGEFAAVAFEHGGNLQGGGIDTVERGCRVPLGIVGGVVEIDGVVVYVEVGSRHRKGCFLLAEDVDDDCCRGEVVAGTCHDEAVGVEGLDFARILPHGDFARLGKGAEIDNGHGTVIDGFAVGIVLPAVAYIQVVAYDTELFRLHAAERTGGLDGEGCGVNTHDGFVVAGDINLTIERSNIARAALTHVDLFDALARGWVDDLDGVGIEDGGVEVATIVDQVLGKVAETTAIIAAEPVEDNGVAIFIQEAYLGIVSAPGAFAEQIDGSGGRSGIHRRGNRVFFASGQQNDSQQGDGEKVLVHEL